VILRLDPNKAPQRIGCTSVRNDGWGCHLLRLMERATRMVAKMSMNYEMVTAAKCVSLQYLDL